MKTKKSPTTLRPGAATAAAASAVAAVTFITAFAAQSASAAVSVRDDDGNLITLQKPALRIIAMAPHVTELLYAAGGGDKIVGAVTYSDFPEAAKKIPRIGTNRQIDMERVIAMKPDLIVAWMHGSSERQIETLRQLGIPIFHSEPLKLDGIADSLNTRPRATHNWHTPLQVFAQTLASSHKPSTSVH